MPGILVVFVLLDMNPINGFFINLLSSQPEVQYMKSQEKNYAVGTRLSTVLEYNCKKSKVFILC